MSPNLALALIFIIVAIFFVMKSLRLRFIEDLIEYINDHDITHWLKRKSRTFNINDAVSSMLIITAGVGIYMYSTI